MPQDERWMVKYQEVLQFLEQEHQIPSKYVLKDRNLYTWMKHQRILLNTGNLKHERIEKFKDLLAMCKQYKRKNQY